LDQARGPSTCGAGSLGGERSIPNLADPYIIPSAPGPGVDGVPRVVLCWLPGGMMVACPVPKLSAREVRSHVADNLCMRVDELSDYVLLLCDLHGPGSLQLWSEAESLPATFFEPKRASAKHSGCRVGRRRATVRNPTLMMCRMRPVRSDVAAPAASSAMATPSPASALFPTPSSLALSSPALSSPALSPRLPESDPAIFQAATPSTLASESTILLPRSGSEELSSRLCGRAGGEAAEEACSPSAAEEAMAGLTFLDSETALERLRRGDLPLDVASTCELAAIALLLVAGPTDVVHTDRLLQRLLPRLAPALQSRSLPLPSAHPLLISRWFSRWLYCASVPGARGNGSSFQGSWSRRKRREQQQEQQQQQQTADAVLHRHAELAAVGPTALEARQLLLRRLRQAMPVIRSAAATPAAKPVAESIEASTDFDARLFAELGAWPCHTFAGALSCGGLRAHSCWRRLRSYPHSAAVCMSVAESGLALIAPPSTCERPPRSPTEPLPNPARAGTAAESGGSTDIGIAPPAAVDARVRGGSSGAAAADGADEAEAQGAQEAHELTRRPTLLSAWLPWRALFAWRWTASSSAPGGGQQLELDLAASSAGEQLALHALFGSLGLPPPAANASGHSTLCFRSDHAAFVGCLLAAYSGLVESRPAAHHAGSVAPQRHRVVDAHAGGAGGMTMSTPLHVPTSPPTPKVHTDDGVTTSTKAIALVDARHAPEEARI